MNESPNTTPPADGTATTPGERDADSRRLRRIALRVIIVQTLALLALWLIQARYHGAP